jgi:hypothetical protein
MAEIFLEYQKIPYMVDIDSSKVFRMDGLALVEVSNLEILQGLRLKSTEIPFSDAQRLSACRMH